MAGADGRLTRGSSTTRMPPRTRNAARAMAHQRGRPSARREGGQHRGRPGAAHVRLRLAAPLPPASIATSSFAVRHAPAEADDRPRTSGGRGPRSPAGMPSAPPRRARSAAAPRRAPAPSGTRRGPRPGSARAARDPRAARPVRAGSGAARRPRGSARRGRRPAPGRAGRAAAPAGARPAGASSTKVARPSSSATHSIGGPPVVGGRSHGRLMPARRRRSPTRSSCSRRNDGPGAGRRELSSGPALRPRVGFRRQVAVGGRLRGLRLELGVDRRELQLEHLALDVG